MTGPISALEITEKQTTGEMYEVIFQTINGLIDFHAEHGSARFDKRIVEQHLAHQGGLTPYEIEHIYWPDILYRYFKAGWQTAKLVERSSKGKPRDEFFFNRE